MSGEDAPIMYELSVMMVRDPGCFFCEILKVTDNEEYERLYEELNLLYGLKYRHVEELRPTVLPVGMLCMVFCEELKSWCRASLESTACSADKLVECFLLDHAAYHPVKIIDVRLPVEACRRLPFRVTRFRLHQIQPLSLRFNVVENGMDYHPAKHWDTAAIHYFKELLQEATKVEAQICSVEEDCVSVHLYVTNHGTVMCANDDLVTKQYAYYESRVEVIPENGKSIHHVVMETLGCQTEEKSVSPSKDAQITATKSPKMISHPLWPAWSSLYKGADENMNHEVRDHMDETRAQQEAGNVEPKSNQNDPKDSTKGTPQNPSSSDIPCGNGVRLSQSKSLSPEGQEMDPDIGDLMSTRRQNENLLLPNLESRQSQDQIGGRLGSGPKSGPSEDLNEHRLGPMPKNEQLSLENLNESRLGSQGLLHKDKPELTEPSTLDYKHGVPPFLISRGNTQSSVRQGTYLQADKAVTGTGAVSHPAWCIMDKVLNLTNEPLESSAADSRTDKEKTWPPVTEPEMTRLPVSDKKTGPPVMNGEKTWPPVNDQENTWPPDTKNEKTKLPDAIKEKTWPPDSIKEKTWPPNFIREKTYSPVSDKKTQPPVMDGEKIWPPVNDQEKTWPAVNDQEKTWPPDTNNEKTKPPDAIKEKTWTPDYIREKTYPPLSDKKTRPPVMNGEKIWPSVNDQEKTWPQNTKKEKTKEPDPIKEKTWPPDGIGEKTCPPVSDKKTLPPFMDRKKKWPTDTDMEKTWPQDTIREKPCPPVSDREKSWPRETIREKPCPPGSDKKTWPPYMERKKSWPRETIREKPCPPGSDKSWPSYMERKKSWPQDAIREKPCPPGSDKKTWPPYMERKKSWPQDTIREKPCPPGSDKKTWPPYMERKKSWPRETIREKPGPPGSDKKTRPTFIDREKTWPPVDAWTPVADKEETCSLVNNKEKTWSSVRNTWPPVNEDRGSSDTEGFSPVKSPWPALSDVDRSLRLSTENMEKAFSKIRTLSDDNIPTPSYNPKQVFNKFLRFVSPAPAQGSEEENDGLQVVVKTPSSIFVSRTLSSYPSLESSILASKIKERLKNIGYSGPNVAESFCWTPIAQGSDTIVICPDGASPMLYIPPLLTYLNCAALTYRRLAAKHGPHAIILCPGWDACHSVYSALISNGKCVRPLQPSLLLVGSSKEEIESLNFRKQSEVLVTTPHILLRCMELHGLLLLRLCHLILTEADLLFTKAAPQMSAILEAFKKTVSAETRQGTPQQIVAVGSKWHRDMELIIKYTLDPRIIITRMEQAAVFANVQLVLHMCLDCDKISMLLQCLEFVPLNVQKILIFTRSDEEAELVHKAVQTSSIYTLLLTRRLVHAFAGVLEQWRKVSSCGTMVALVVTDDYAPIREITDATCILHYSFPDSAQLLSLRLFSLLDYIRSKIDEVRVEEPDHLRAKSIFLMTEKHGRHAVDVLSSLRQAQAEIPPELLHFIEGIQHAREEANACQRLCQHLKSFGYCSQDRLSCPSRHRLNPALDRPGELGPAEQYLTVLPLYIQDASQFYGRIVTQDKAYEKLCLQLGEYYSLAENRKRPGEVETNQVYALCEAPAYHRVQVLQARKVGCVSYVTVQFIDQGGTDQIPAHKLMTLPTQCQSLPPQCQEFILCRVKPIDQEEKWEPKVTRLISKSIRGKLHRARVVLHLGNTYWLDPMVQMSTLTGLSTPVYELNVRQEILESGLGTDNPEHVTNLKAALGLTDTPLGNNRLSDEPAVIQNHSLEEQPTTRPPEEPPATSPAEERPATSPAEERPATSPAEERPATSPAEERPATSPAEKREVTEPPEGRPIRGPSEEGPITSPNEERTVTHPSVSQHAPSFHPPAAMKKPDEAEETNGAPKATPKPPPISFHPEVKWFERGDTIVLDVKLREISDHKCHFTNNRVVFSCQAEGKLYAADLELCKEIAAEKCRCAVRNGEAIITLQKKKPVTWHRLLANKHPKVTYNYDHLEDSEDSSGFLRVSIPGRKNYTLVSEDMMSSDYSESDSSTA